MNYEIKEVQDKVAWENFVREYSNNFLLQSWNWGEFAHRQGRKVFRLGLFDGDHLVGAMQVVKVESRRADYLETHGAPMVDYSGDEQFGLMHQYLFRLAQTEKVHFFRIRLPLFHSDETIRQYINMGYHRAPMFFHAEHTLWLDLSQSEEQLLAGMRKNTRYYVHKAEKMGVAVEFSQDPLQLDTLFDLYEQTVERQEFVPYGKSYFMNEFNSFIEDDQVELVVARHAGQPIGAAMIVYSGGTAYYHHSGSVRNNPDVYGNYLLQWEVIKRAKGKGMCKYDFFGVAPTDDSKHPRAGLTLFKRGFGGERVRLMHTLDYPMKWRYWPLYAFVKLEKFQRGL